MCGRCGKEHGRRCPASGQQCHMCKKIGHFASVCRGRHRSAQEVETQAVQHDTGETEEYWLNVITCPDNSPPWEVQLPIGGSVKLFKIDIGADISVMTSESFNALKEKQPLKPTTVNLMSPGGRVSTQGKITVETTYKKSSV